MPSAPELVAPCRAELKAREQGYPLLVESMELHPDEADRDLAAWRRIVTLAETGEVALDDEENPADAMAALVAAAQAGLDRRVAKCAESPSDAAERRIAALRNVRDRLLRGAIRAGARLPSFDHPPAGLPA